MTELLIAFALIAWEMLRPPPQPVTQPSKEPEDEAIQLAKPPTSFRPLPKPKLVSSRAPSGSVSDYVLARLEAAHPKAGHFYLAVLGVEPESQGRGLGSALMFPVLRRCDAERIPAYLEASSPRNRDLYLRHGFEVTRELRVGSGAPPIWGMWREPS